MLAAIRSTLVASFLMLAAGVTAGAHAQLTPQEARGRDIYFGASGSALERNTSTFANSEAEFPASAFPCSSCHGERGIGRAERGVTPSNLQRAALTKPYGETTSEGRIRPAYTRETFASALRRGIGPSGRPLADAMPRYKMTDADVADLWSFLGRLETLNAPGVTETSITLGAVLPLRGAATAEGAVMLATLRAVADATNAQGGVFGRKVLIRAIDAGSATIDSIDVFAIATVAGLPQGVDLPAAPPIIGPWAQEPAENQQNVFYLTSRQADQVHNLKTFAETNLGHTSVGLCDGVASEGRIVTTDCLETYVGAKSVLLPIAAFQSLSGEQLAKLPSETYVALPSSPSLFSREAQQAFARIRANGPAPRQYVLAQAHAYSSAVLTLEVLKRSGRDLSRQKFIQELHKVRDFVGAMTPPLSFTAQRRVGSRGAYVVRYDPKTGQLAPEGAWIDG